LRLFFGRSYFESEVKRREYFSGQDFPPTIGKKVLEDKTVIPFWYKLPDQLMKHQLKSMVTTEQLEGLQRVAGRTSKGGLYNWWGSWWR